MEIIKIEETDSTNNWLLRHEEEMGDTVLVYSVKQTSGRGQRGNSWESEPGKNITASLLFHPQKFPANQQFFISEAIALAIVEFLKSQGVEAKVKWPNDIYVGDRKICGILVEHKVIGKEITRTIAGFGINLNQTRFISDAPNPVSLRMLTETVYDLDKSVEELSEYLEEYLQNLSEGDSLHVRFNSILWRGDGLQYKFFDRKQEQKIDAYIDSVKKDGVLTLVTSEGEERNYYFKEVEFLL